MVVLLLCNFIAIIAYNIVSSAQVFLQWFGSGGWVSGREYLACKKLSDGALAWFFFGERCKWSAYGPADATTTPTTLASLKCRMVYLSGAGLPRLSLKRGR